MPDQDPFTSDETPRLDDIEIKLAFAEELLETLNRTVAKQADQIDALSREVIALRKRQDNSERSDSGTGHGANANTNITAGTGETDGSASIDDRPPHY